MKKPRSKSPDNEQHRQEILALLKETPDLTAPEMDSRLNRTRSIDRCRELERERKLRRLRPVHNGLRKPSVPWELIS